jgi:hypothetical protein
MTTSQICKHTLKTPYPLWEEGMSDWTKILETRTTPTRQTQILIINVTATHAKPHSGDNPRLRHRLDTFLSTLAATLTLLAYQEHKKLPKYTIPTQIIHATWYMYINQENLPHIKNSNYDTITTHPSMGRGTTKRRRATHQEHTYMTPSESINTPYDILEIQDHRYLNNQTTYMVTQFSPEILTQE